MAVGEHLFCMPLLAVAVLVFSVITVSVNDEKRRTD